MSQPYNPQQPPPPNQQPQQPYNPQQQYAPPPPQYAPPAPVKKGLPKWAFGCGGALLVIIVVIIIGATAKPKAPVTGATATGSPKPTTAAAIVNTPAPAEPTIPPTDVPTAIPPTPVPLAPSYAEMMDKKAASTDAQWDEYAKGLKGLRVENWEGEILNVDQKFASDNYWVSVDMDGKEGLMKDDAKVEVTKADALTMSKGQHITFSGEINAVNCLSTYCPVEVIRATFTVK